MNNLTGNGSDNHGEVTRGIWVEVDLGIAPVDAYQLPDGERRLGIKQTSIALGYTERWFYNRTKRASKWLEGLQDKGFTGSTKDLQIGRDQQRGSSVSRTISVRDFTKLVTHEALQGNRKAIALLGAFAEIGIEKVLDNAFKGVSNQSFQEKILHYTQWTHEEYEEALAANREDVKALNPWRLQE